MRMRDSVIGAYKPDFLEKTSDSADLCARRCFLHMVAGIIILQSLKRSSVPSATHITYNVEIVQKTASLQQSSACHLCFRTQCPCRYRTCFSQPVVGPALAPLERQTGLA